MLVSCGWNAAAVMSERPVSVGRNLLRSISSGSVPSAVPNRTATGYRTQQIDEIETTCFWFGRHGWVTEHGWGRVVSERTRVSLRTGQQKALLKMQPQLKGRLPDWRGPGEELRLSTERGPWWKYGFSYSGILKIIVYARTLRCLPQKTRPGGKERVTQWQWWSSQKEDACSNRLPLLSSACSFWALTLRDGAAHTRSEFSFRQCFW